MTAPVKFGVGLLLIFVLLVLLAYHPWRQEIHLLQGRTMGTAYSVQVPVSDLGRDAGMLAEEIASLLLRLDKELMSTYVDDSQLSRFNQAPPGSFFPVAPELLAVVRLALEVEHQSAGAFDISIAPLVNLWGFGPQVSAMRVPEQAAIAEAMALGGTEALEFSENPPALLKRRALSLDLSAIAKGYAVDRLAAYLESRGFDRYLVEIGGELRVKGEKPGGKDWILAIESPVPEGREAFQRLTSRGRSLALAGSGDYRNYYEVEGQRYSHEIDPRSGRPVRHSLAAVTVVAESAAKADAWATALMVLGAEEGAALASRVGIAAYFIIRDDDRFRAQYTDNFAIFLYD